MDKLNAIEQQFKDALQRLSEILNEPKTTVIRDASLKRFEFTFDLAWKLLRELLQKEKGVICIAPKECIREAFRHHFIDNDTIWLDMTDWRNAIVHEYREDYADFIFEQLPQVSNVLQKLLTTIESKKNNH